MSYTPTTWTNGDSITAEKLNKIENGIENAGGTLIVTATYNSESNSTTLNKTWQQIYDALVAGKRIILIDVDDSSSQYYPAAAQTDIFAVSYNNSKYQVVTSGGEGISMYFADTTSDYPSYKHEPV